MKDKSGDYVIGVDGGGTKTIAALADLKGKILKIGKAGPSNPRNVGIKKTSENIAQAIKKVLKKRKAEKILSTFIGLAAVEEEYRSKKGEIKKELLRQKETSKILKGKLIIGSDQAVAFRSGANKKEGIILIAGTGTSCHGWRKGKDVKSSGWGYLADEGSAFWVGQKVFQTILKELDGRGPKTLLTKIVFQKLKTELPLPKVEKKEFSLTMEARRKKSPKFSSPIKNKENLLTKIYSKNPTEIIPLFSVFCDNAAKKGDGVAREILVEAAKELAFSVKIVIKKLNFKNQKFPLVLVGGMFESRIILETVKREIKKFAPKVKFIHSKKESVCGAVKLAIEYLDDRNFKSKTEKFKANN